jgi:hypothetical protein
LRTVKYIKHQLVFIILISLPACGIAAPYYGFNLGYVAVSKEPSNIQGFQFTVNEDPQRFKWRQFNVYFDGGFTYFKVPNAANNASINIFSAAPVVRYTFRRRGPILPYLELSIGLSYLNRTHLDDRNLGIHFAFQDRFGLGAFLGTSEQLSIGIHSVHYSNARLSSHNSGITVPLVLDVGYRFR